MSEAVTVKYAIDAKLFYCAAGIGASPTWTELAIVKDVTLTMEKNEFDVSTRANGGWKAAAGGMKEASIEFEMLWDPSNAGFVAVESAFIANTPIGIACMDGAIAGGRGLWADMAVLGFTRNEKLEEGITATVKMKPTYSANPPQYKTGS